MNDVLNRAFKTFVETLITAVIGSFAFLDWSNPDQMAYNFFTVILFPAACTALSAAWNQVENYLFKRNNTTDEEEEIAEGIPEVNPVYEDPEEGVVEEVIEEVEFETYEEESFNG